MWMYVGTYTRDTSRGISGLNLDEAAGTFSEPKLMAETPNPSFLAITADGKRLYAACDPGPFDGKSAGGVAAFAVDPSTRALAVMNREKSSAGGNCFVGLTPDGTLALAADYGGAVVSVLPIRSDGTLSPVSAVDHHEGHGPDKERQEKAHAHSFYADPTGRFLLSCDLGSDEVYVYRSNNPARLTRHSVYKALPGVGPRHLAFAGDRRRVYLLTEMGNTVEVLRWDEQAGTLERVQSVSTLPADFTAYSKAAEVAVHPSGAFVYASNRGHDSIAVFHVDRDTGRLSPAGHTPTGGKGPRHFAIDPTGKFLVAANEQSDNLVAFRIDPDTGTLTPTGGTAGVSRPVCVLFPPT